MKERGWEGNEGGRKGKGVDGRGDDGERRGRAGEGRGRENNDTYIVKM